MRYIRLLVFSVVTLGLIITLISLFFPSEIHISRAVDITSGKEKAKALIAEPANWKQWFPGADSAEYYIENGVIKGITGKDNSRFVITTISDSTVVVEHTGAKGGTSVMGWRIISVGDNPGFSLQWYMDFNLRWYPWEKFSGLILDKVYGPDMERGLSRLKDLAEN